MKEELSFRLAKPNDRDDVLGKSHFFRIVNHSLTRGRCPLRHPSRCSHTAIGIGVASYCVARSDRLGRAALYDRNPLIQRSRGSARRRDLRWCFGVLLYVDEPMNSSSLSLVFLYRVVLHSVPQSILSSRAFLPHRDSSLCESMAFSLRYDKCYPRQ